MTAWAHLPNAAHIDAVLAHVRAYPGKWSAAYVAAWDAARSAARSAAWDDARSVARSVARSAAWDAARDAARDAAQGAARSATQGAVWDSLLALIAYDDSAYYLKLTPGAVRVAASAGIPAAVLLLPAVTAMNSAP